MNPRRTGYEGAYPSWTHEHSAARLLIFPGFTQPCLLVLDLPYSYSTSLHCSLLILAYSYSISLYDSLLILDILVNIKLNDYSYSTNYNSLNSGVENSRGTFSRSSGNAVNSPREAPERFFSILDFFVVCFSTTHGVYFPSRSWFHIVLLCFMCFFWIICYVRWLDKLMMHGSLKDEYE